MVVKVLRLVLMVDGSSCGGEGVGASIDGGWE